MSNEQAWSRIPAAVQLEEDRRSLCAVLSALGLEIRVVKVKPDGRGAVKRYIEYRPQQPET